VNNLIDTFNNLIPGAGYSTVMASILVFLFKRYQKNVDKNTDDLNTTIKELSLAINQLKTEIGKISTRNDEMCKCIDRLQDKVFI
jgi:hypothetical protein